MPQEDRIVSVTGLGYVGLPVAVAFGKKVKTIGFDINQKRIYELKEGIDSTCEVEENELKFANILFTNNVEDLKSADFHIIAVPTPVDDVHQPDLTLLLKASRIVGSILKKGDIVVYESTVYPGATEDECIPVLEEASGLKCGTDFKVGYSPERINPGDKEHTFTKIKKIVSGQDNETLEIVAQVYGLVVTAGIYKAESIKVAEAAKIIENTQRDLNIALMNELAIIFDKLGINTQKVLDAAGTKWNFLQFKPGLVGGHCIGVDPYYLTFKAQKIGYMPQVILAGRGINDSMGKFIAQQTIKEMIHAGHHILNSVVTVLGLTFKENCPDIRNSKVVDIIAELEEYGIHVQVSDPLADFDVVKSEYGISLTPMDMLKPSSAVVMAVAHDAYRKLTIADIIKLMDSAPVLVDVKGICDLESCKTAGIRLWQL